MRHAPTFWLAAGLAAAAAADLISPSSALAFAQSDAATTPQPTGPYWAIVKGDNVMLRSAASIASGYPFGKLFAGKPVKVLDVSNGWARVQAVGPTFDDFFGFVKNSSATQYDSSTKTLMITGKASLLAPNQDAKFAPDKSWRELVALTAGDSLRVVDEVKGQNDSYYSVRLPDRASGWVTLMYLEPAPQAQADQFEAALQNSAGASVRPRPTPPANNAPNGGVVGGAAPKGETTTSTPPTNDSAITNNPPTDDSAPTAEADAEDAARAAARAEAERIRKEQQASVATYSSLEQAWSRVKQEPEASQELDALRQGYLALIDNGYAPNTTRELAKMRAEQIGLRIEVQNELLKLAEIKRKKTERGQSLVDLTLANEKRRAYDAVGRLSASTVYNGDRLPLLYKVSDPTTGYTLAYITPGPTTKPSEALGLLVGIKGRKQYDEALRINVYVPEMLETLGKETTTVIGPDGSKPTER